MLTNDFEFSSLQGILKWYMNKPVKIQDDELADRISIPESFIKDLHASGAEYRKFRLSYLVAIAIELKMTPEHALDFIHADGYYLRKKIPEEKHYLFFLKRSGKISVLECNRILKHHGLPPLTPCKN